MDGKELIRLTSIYSDEILKELSSSDMLKDRKIAENYLEYIYERGELPTNMNDVLPLKSIKAGKFGQEVHDFFFKPRYEWTIPNNGGSSTFIDWLKHEEIITDERYNISQNFTRKVQVIIERRKLRDEYKKNLLRLAEYSEYIEAIPELTWDDLFVLITQKNKNVKFKMPSASEYKEQEFDPKNTTNVQIIRIDQIPESMSEPSPTHLYKASVCMSKHCQSVFFSPNIVRYCKDCGTRCRPKPEDDIIIDTYFGSCFISSTVDGNNEEKVFQYHSWGRRVAGTDLKVACINREIGGRYLLLILAFEHIYPEDLVHWNPNPKEDVGYQIVQKIKKRYKQVFKRDFKGMDIILYSTVLLRMANEMGYKKNILFVGKGGVGKTYAFRIASFAITNPSLVAVMNAGRITVSGLTGSMLKMKLEKGAEVNVRKPGLLTDKKMLVLDEYTAPGGNADSNDLKALRNSLSENTITYGLSAGSGEIPKKASCMAIMNPPKKTEYMARKFLKDYNYQNNRNNTLEDFHKLMSDRDSEIYKQFVNWASDMTEDYRTGMAGPDNDRFFLAFFSEEPEDIPDRSPSAYDDVTLKKKMYMPDVEAFINKRGRQYFNFASVIDEKLDKKIYNFAKKIHKKKDFTSFGRIVEFIKTLAYAIMALNNQEIPDEVLFHKISIIYDRTANWKRPKDFEWTENEIEFLKNPVGKENILKLLDLTDNEESTVMSDLKYEPRMA